MSGPSPRRGWVRVEDLTKRQLRSVLTDLGRSAAGSKTLMAARMAEIPLAPEACVELDLDSAALFGVRDAEGKAIEIETLRQPVQIELEPPAPVRNPAKTFPGAEILVGHHTGRMEGAKIIAANVRNEGENISASAVSENLSSSRKRPRPDDSLQNSLEKALDVKGSVIVVLGKTGTGKTQLLRRIERTSEQLHAAEEIAWNAEQAIVSQFGTVDEASKWLLAVGLTSIPSWCKPYHILSTGERYRAVIARLLQKASQTKSHVLVLDNFTSQLDRDTARACSAALAKQVRKFGLVCVVSTGLLDTVEWLSPEVIISTDGSSGATVHTNNDFTGGPRVRISISRQKVLKPLREGIDVSMADVQDANLPSAQVNRLRDSFQFEVDNIEEAPQTQGGTVLLTKVKTDEATQSCDRLFDNAFDGQCMLHVPSRSSLAEDEDSMCQFRLGVITGLSGSAKSVLLRQHFGPPTEVCWSPGHSVNDHFASAKDAKEKLNVVCLDAEEHGGRSYSELSAGEQELANLARLLNHQHVYLDEFTSTLDRQLGVKVAYSLAQFLNAQGEKNQGWVIVTCHADVLSPLAQAAQWMYDTWKGPFRPPEDLSDPSTRNPDSRADGEEGLLSELQREGVLSGEHGQMLRRPCVDLRFARCEPWLWSLFRDHHYKTKNLSRKARCFVLFQERTGTLVGFLAVIQQVGTPHEDADGFSYESTWRAHRTVVLPSWQGLGIGSRLSDASAEVHRQLSCMYMAQTVHPRFGNYRDRSPLWEAAKWNHSTRAYKIETWKQRLENKRIKLRIPRFVYAHVYKGPAEDDEAMKASFTNERIQFDDDEE